MSEITLSFNWLTARDKEIYEYLKRHTRYVTTSQLTELFFTHDANGKPIKNARLVCRRRMAALESNIPEVQSFYRQANTDKIYSCLPTKENIISLSRIEHSLALNDIYIKLRCYAKEHGHSVYDFRVEQKIKDDIIPDIILVYMIDNKARAYYIEYDTGTESLPRIGKKIDKYNAYLSKQLYLTEDWQPSKLKPEVVFITTKDTRADKINKLGYRAVTDVIKILG